MAKPTRAGQLDQAIDALLAGRAGQAADADIAPLLAIARELRALPRENFKARLKSDLERKTLMASQAATPAAVRQTAIPRLRVRNAAAAIDFYKQALGATELMRFVAHGEIAHAELAIGNSVIMLGEEAPEYGFAGPETLGGSPVSIALNVDDVDAFVERAVAAGARITGPVSDKFYGDRSGSVADPFGYTWNIVTRKHEMSVEEMHRHFAAMEEEQRAKPTAPSPIPEGYHTVTPYLVVQDAPGLIDFTKRVFDAEEKFRAIGSAGGVHAELRLGDSMLMLGGGAPDLAWQGPTSPGALHVYVADTDDVYRRALEAGAEAIQAPEDHPYGERGASVRDPFGNHWYIATAKGESYTPEGMRTVTPTLHPLRADPVIGFLMRGFGAQEIARYATPEGVIHHASIRIGDSVLELGEAHGPYQPMPGMFYLHVPNVDASYVRALGAGAVSIGEPADQSYGVRRAGVQDAFGNQWYMATPIQDVKS